MNQIFRSNRTSMNSTLSRTTVKKAASLQGVFKITGNSSQAKFGTDDYFTELCKKLKNGKDRNTDSITFDTNNKRKHDFMLAVFEGLNRIPAKDEGMQDHEYLNKLVNNFNQPYGEYLHDLKRACEYLIRDRAKNQGGKAFTDFIQNVLHIFTAIEKLVELCSNKDNQFKKADVEENSETEKGKRLRQISSEFEDEINKAGTSGSKYGFGATATGAVIGTGTGASYSSLSFLIGTLANLKAFAVTIASGLVAGAAIGYGVYKGVQYSRDGNSQKRLNELHERSFAPSSVESASSILANEENCKPIHSDVTPCETGFVKFRLVDLTVPFIEFPHRDKRPKDTIYLDERKLHYFDKKEAKDWVIRLMDDREIDRVMASKKKASKEDLEQALADLLDVGHIILEMT